MSQSTFDSYTDEATARNEVISIWQSQSPFQINQLLGIEVVDEINPNDFTVKGFNVKGMRVLSDLATSVQNAIDAYGEIYAILPKDYGFKALRQGLARLLDDVYRLTFGDEPVGYMISPLDSDLGLCTDGINELVDYLDEHGIVEPAVDEQIDRLVLSVVHVRECVDIFDDNVFPDDELDY